MKVFPLLTPPSQPPDTCVIVSTPSSPRPGLPRHWQQVLWQCRTPPLGQPQGHLSGWPVLGVRDGGGWSATGAGSSAAQRVWKTGSVFPRFRHCRAAGGHRREAGTLRGDKTAQDDTLLMFYTFFFPMNNTFPKLTDRLKRQVQRREAGR